MNRIIRFGEKVKGYDIPVLNEREVRAAAGILLLVMFYAATRVIHSGDFTLIKYSVTFFLIDFIIRVFISPNYSPTLIIGRMIVANQTPEYVSAAPKKFAWVFGVVLSLTMFILLVVMNVDSPVAGIICVTCLVFLFFESAFGICLGCKFYPLFFKDKARYCPGDVCEIKTRHEIQNTSKTQLLVVLTFIAVIFLTMYLFNEIYQKRPPVHPNIENNTAVK